MQIAAHHMSFPIKDLERSRKFYQEILGLTEIPRPDFGVPGLWLQAGAGQVHLIQVEENWDVGTPPETLNPAGRHAAFAVKDYTEALVHLKKAGLEVLETSKEKGQMWVKDPDGHIIEFICPA